jgi:hypothetical protein
MELFPMFGNLAFAMFKRVSSRIFSVNARTIDSSSAELIA